MTNPRDTHQFVMDLRQLRFDNAFNPYAHRCRFYDRQDAPEIRATVLEEILTVAAGAVPVDAIWIGRDLGYKGGRRTGLAFTDDKHAPEHAARWLPGVTQPRPTKGPPLKELSATVIWRMLSRIQDVPIFLWNVFPLHPHEPAKPFTNRPHTPPNAKPA